MNVELNPGEQLDILKKSGYKIIQNKQKFMFGIDAFLLADFCQIRNNEIVVDFGTGTGIIPLLLANSRADKIFALEIQKESYEMAKKSVQINNLSEKIKIINGDIKNASQILRKNFCNVVISNPPYLKTTTGKQNPEEAKNIARHEVLCNIENLFQSAKEILKSNGRFYLIHRPERLSEIILNAEKFDFKVKSVQFIHPFAEKNATMVLIESRKNANDGTKVLNPLIMYDSPGKYTQEVLEIYNQL